jgi:hypothetical protein
MISRFDSFIVFTPPFRITRAACPPPCEGEYSTKPKGQERKNMFNNLQAAMDEKDITRTQLAAILGIDIKSVTNKMSGTTEWKLSEILEINSLFPKYRQDWLFKQFGDDWKGAR